MQTFHLFQMKSFWNAVENSSLAMEMEIFGFTITQYSFMRAQFFSFWVHCSIVPMRLQLERMDFFGERHRGEEAITVPQFMTKYPSYSVISYKQFSVVIKMDRVLGNACYRSLLRPLFLALSFGTYLFIPVLGLLQTWENVTNYCLVIGVGTRHPCLS